jgi:RNA polymerase sigma-70 factor (ECF subfamily)
MMEKSDAELWRLVSEGDRDAFGALFERHGLLLYNYCFRRTGDWAQAEDLVSVVFLEAWRRRDKRLPPDKVLPWLYGIATNVVRNHRRSLRRSAAALIRLRGEPEVDMAEAVAERIDDQQLARRALELLSQLSVRDQDVVALCDGMGLSYEDAACALGVPVGTVRSRLSRGRTRLQELIAGCGHKQLENTNLQEARSHN